MHRLTISITPKQAALLDDFIALKRYRNRSEGFRDMIKRAIEHEPLASGKCEICAAHLSFAFDSHQLKVVSQFAAIYHAHGHIILSTTRTVMSETVCIEAVTLRGGVANISALANLIFAVNGVRNGLIIIIPVS